MPAAGQSIFNTSAHNAIVEQAWLDDPDSSLSAQQSLAAHWTSFTGSLTRGYTRSTTWIKLRIDPAMVAPGSLASDHRLVLRIYPGHVDEIAVFRTSQLSEPPILLGDRHAPKGPQQGLTSYAVVFDDAQSPFDILIRLRSQSNHAIFAQATRWDESLAAVHDTTILITAYLVFTLGVIAWALVNWLQQKDLALALFIAHQIGFFLLAILLLGVARMLRPDWMPPAMIDKFTSLMIAVQTLLGILFHTCILDKMGAAKAETALLKWLGIFPIFAIMLILFGPVRAGLLLSQATIAIFQIPAAIIAWRIHAHRTARGEPSDVRLHAFRVSVYLVMALLSMPSSLRVLGVIRYGGWNYTGFMIYGIASALLLAGLLVLYSQEERRRKSQIRKTLEKTVREAEIQKARAVDQAELMVMLTHELKTPLSIISLALGKGGQQHAIRERAVRAVNNMRSVIERCADAARIDTNAMTRESTLSLAPVTLKQVLADSISVQAQPGRIAIEQRDDLPQLITDQKLLMMIVNNLLENALKYGPRDGPVRLETRPENSRGRPGVALRVFNETGPAGRPDATKVFEKYYRAPSARRQSGSGLGLYLSKRLAFTLGGDLLLRENEKDEVCFELWLPCSMGASTMQ